MTLFKISTLVLLVVAYGFVILNLYSLQSQIAELGESMDRLESRLDQIEDALQPFMLPERN